MADNPFQSTLNRVTNLVGLSNDDRKPVSAGATTAYQAMQSVQNAPHLDTSIDYKKYLTPTGDNKNKTGTAQTPTSGGADYGSYLSSLMAQRQAAAQDAYNNAIGRINDAFNSAANSFGNIYNRGVSTLQGSYNNSQNKINNQASDSMQEAYVNKMLSQKNLAQQLAAQGMSGGASESAMAGLINNYGNARNGIQRTWNDNLSDLEQTYNSNLNDLYSAYQSQMAQLANQRANAINSAEMNLANMISDGSGSLYQALLSMSPTTLQNALNGAVANQSAFTPQDTVATNTYNPVNTQQANDMGGNLTNWEAWKNFIDNSGSTTDEKILNLKRAGLDDNTIYAYMNQYLG